MSLLVPGPLFLLSLLLLSSPLPLLPPTTASSAHQAPPQRLPPPLPREPPPNSNVVLVFLHVPKTGGAFVGEYLRRTIATDTRWGSAFSVAINPTAFLDLDQASQARYAAVHGHLGYGIQHDKRWKLDGLLTPAYATVLRDPVDRLVSQFLYEKESPMRLSWGAKLPPRGATPTAADLFAWLDEMIAVPGRRTDHSMWSAHRNPMTQQMCCWGADGIRGELEQCTGPAVTEDTLSCAKNHLVRRRGKNELLELPRWWWAGRYGHIRCWRRSSNGVHRGEAQVVGAKNSSKVCARALSAHSLVVSCAAP
jgi:hypothetical protein